MSEFQVPKDLSSYRADLHKLGTNQTVGKPDPDAATVSFEAVLAEFIDEELEAEEQQSSQFTMGAEQKEAPSNSRVDGFRYPGQSIDDWGA